MFRALILVIGLIGLASWAGCDGCSGGGFDAGVPDSPVVGGTFSLAWTLLDQATSKPVTCDKLDPNGTVFIQASRVGTGGLESFACKNMQATSIGRFAPGVYNFSYELHVLAAGQVVTIPTSGQSGVVINAGENTVLAPITFPVTATGQLALMLHTGPSGNCAGGAGITEIAISFEHAGGPSDSGCQAVTFTLPDGSTATFDDCSSPKLTRCINATETLTSDSLPSGPYQIHITGQKGTAECWFNNDTIRVPPQGTTLSQALNLAPATPACP